MAEALISLVLKKFKPIMDAVSNFPKNIIKLEMTCRMLHAFVHDAERKQWKNEVARIWVSQLKEVAYDVDDLLDEWNTEMQREEQREKKREKKDGNTLVEKISDYTALEYNGFACN